jgi:hypothetical protein
MNAETKGEMDMTDNVLEPASRKLSTDEVDAVCGGQTVVAVFAVPGYHLVLVGDTTTKKVVKTEIIGI